MHVDSGEDSSQSGSEDEILSLSLTLSSQTKRRNRGNTVKHSKDQRDRKKVLENDLQKTAAENGYFFLNKTAHLKRNFEVTKLTRVTCFAKVNYLIQILFASTCQGDSIDSASVDFDQLFGEISVVFDPLLDVTLPENYHFFSKPTRTEFSRSTYSGLPALLTYTEGYDAFCVSIANQSRSSNDHFLSVASRLVVRAAVNANTFLLEEGVASVKFEVRTVNAVLCGGKEEFQYSGMLLAAFNVSDITNNSTGLSVTESVIRILKADVYYDAQEVQCKLTECFGVSIQTQLICIACTLASSAIEMARNIVSSDDVILLLTAAEPSETNGFPVQQILSPMDDTNDDVIHLQLKSTDIAQIITTRAQHSLPSTFLVASFDHKTSTELLSSFLHVSDDCLVALFQAMLLSSPRIGAVDSRVKLLVRVFPCCVLENSTELNKGNPTELSENIAPPRQLLWSLSLVPVVDHTHDSLSVSLVTLCLKCVIKNHQKTNENKSSPFCTACLKTNCLGDCLQSVIVTEIIVAAEGILQSVQREEEGKMVVGSFVIWVDKLSVACAVHHEGKRDKKSHHKSTHTSLNPSGVENCAVPSSTLSVMMNTDTPIAASVSVKSSSSCSSSTTSQIEPIIADRSVPPESCPLPSTLQSYVFNPSDLMYESDDDVPDIGGVDAHWVAAGRGRGSDKVVKTDVSTVVQSVIETTLGERGLEQHKEEEEEEFDTQRKVPRGGDGPNDEGPPNWVTETRTTTAALSQPPLIESSQKSTPKHTSSRPRTRSERRLAALQSILLSVHTVLLAVRESHLLSLLEDERGRLLLQGRTEGGNSNSNSNDEVRGGVLGRFMEMIQSCE